MSTRVLVVDDASIFRRIISEALSGIPGVEVVGSAANGKLALARLAALRPDVITLDIEMPEMNGLEVLDALRALGGSASVIMLSSQTVKGGQMTIRALEAGAFDFVTKPEGGSSPEQNIAQLRDSLRPIIQALEQRREIRGTRRVHRPRVQRRKRLTRQLAEQVHPLRGDLGLGQKVLHGLVAHGPSTS